MNKFFYTTHNGDGKAGLGSLLQLNLLLLAWGRKNNARVLFIPFQDLGHHQGEENHLLKINSFFKKIQGNPNPDETGVFVEGDYLLRSFGELNYKSRYYYIRNLYNELNYHGSKYYSGKFINIAIHIRSWNQWDRENNCDTMQENVHLREMFVPNVNNDQYFNYLSNIVGLVKSRVGDNIKIYIFSEGNKKDFEIFKKLGNVEIKLNADLIETLYHLISADVLVASKSSLSWSAHLFGMNKLVVARDDFWHSWNSHNCVLVCGRGFRVPFYFVVKRRLHFVLSAILLNFKNLLIDFRLK